MVDCDLSASKTTWEGSEIAVFDRSAVLLCSTVAGDSARGVEAGEPDVVIGEADRFELPSTERLWLLRPKKENMPPAFFFPSSTGDSA
jgi:hypothetical protein